MPQRSLVSTNAMVAAFSQAGDVAAAKRLFDGMLERNAVSWNAMLTGYAQNGHNQEALELVKQMLLHGLEIDHVGGLCLLAACSDVGVLVAARSCFTSILMDHSVDWTREHYYSMINLLGRVGLVSEASQVMALIPGKYQNGAGWKALLTACKLHSNAAQGRLVAREAFVLDPQSSSSYALLATTLSC
ncbi:hypothetical protein SELMODRAFT_137002 [Selaginella moellendorffii]|uniref:Pentacotripeptide-repeat region of PRORP domain-containing protein n=2 Tax=Selaginella moellendorffii TaxID=88036 RepID=D8TCS3_SELML|nr:hypothetical protein SELMODRAFT_137002 [Selaginella moellendorffii]